MLSLNTMNEMTPLLTWLTRLETSEWHAHVNLFAYQDDFQNKAALKPSGSWHGFKSVANEHERVEVRSHKLAPSVKSDHTAVESRVATINELKTCLLLNHATEVNF